MKKIILLFTFNFLLSFFCFSQYEEIIDGSKYIKDKATDEIMYNAVDPRMKGVAYFLKKLKEADDKEKILRDLINKAKKKAGFLKSIKTAKKIDKLLDKMICTKHSISLYAKFINNADCITNLNFEQTLFQYDVCLDWLYLVFAGGIMMEEADRIKTLNDAINRLEKYDKEATHLIRAVENEFNNDLFKIDDFPENHIAVTRRH